MPSGLIPLGFPKKTLCALLSSPYVCHMPHPSHSSSFDHSNNVWWEVQTMKLYVMCSFLLPYYHIPHRPKYLLQQHILEIIICAILCVSQPYVSPFHPTPYELSCYDHICLSLSTFSCVSAVICNFVCDILLWLQCGWMLRDRKVKILMRQWCLELLFCWTHWKLCL